MLPDRRETAMRAADVLRARAGDLASMHALVGFDGFVDDILDAVRVRRSMAPRDYERIETIGEFAERVARAAGVSTNIELVRRESRFGGNGPLLASGLMALGTATTYVGCIGTDEPGVINPLFGAFAGRCERAVALAPPGHTDAMEFNDGKIMFNQTASVQRADWGALEAAVGLEALRAMAAHASVIGMVNWSLCGGVEGIWNGLIERVLPGLPPPVGGRRRIFIDLSDPAKRSDADIERCLEWLGRLSALVPVTLGLNLAEAGRIGRVLGMGHRGTSIPGVRGLCGQAAAILERVGLEAVVIHPRDGAAGAERAGGGVHACWMDGPVTERPRLSTGAGDHFNAGFAAGQLLDLPLAECLSVATAVSGCYVRDAASPGVGRAVEMLGMVARGEA